MHSSFQCPLNGKDQNIPKMLIERNRFLKNDNLVMRISLEGCEDARIRRNIFIRNNKAGQKGALAIHISPKVRFCLFFDPFSLNHSSLPSLQFSLICRRIDSLVKQLMLHKIYLWKIKVNGHYLLPQRV